MPRDVLGDVADSLRTESDAAPVKMCTLPTLAGDTYPQRSERESAPFPCWIHWPHRGRESPSARPRCAPGLDRTDLIVQQTRSLVPVIGQRTAQLTVALVRALCDSELVRATITTSQTTPCLIVAIGSRVDSAVGFGVPSVVGSVAVQRSVQPDSVLNVALYNGPGELDLGPPTAAPRWLSG
jgi:hypothetical protein